MTIKSTDTSDNPVVDPQWLTTETDKQLAIQALKRGREIFNATGLEVGDELYPGPAVQTDEQILAYIQYSLAPIHHAASTCMTFPTFQYISDFCRQNGQEKRFERRRRFKRVGLWRKQLAHC